MTNKEELKKDIERARETQESIEYCGLFELRKE